MKDADVDALLDSILAGIERGFREEDTPETEKGTLPGADSMLRELAYFSCVAVQRERRRAKDSRGARQEAAKEDDRGPLLRDAGIWTAAKSYLPGDVVTHGGTAWVCCSPTTTRPGGDSWRLMVKTPR